MRNRKAIDALSLGVICVAIGIVAFSAWILPPGFNASVYPDVGRVLAQQALAGLPKGGEIVVIARDTQAYPQPAMEIALRALQKEASRAGATVTIKAIQLDPLRPAEVPPGDFYEAIRRAKPNQVIVSLLGPPVLEPEQRAKLGATKPKIVAFCTGSLSAQTDLPDLFQNGLLYAAIVNRQTAGRDQPATAGFDQLYEVLRHDVPPAGIGKTAERL
jgi:hypothetical protein